MNNSAEQLFIREALELLKEIKEGLQNLSQNPNRNTTETLIKATQIIQGGASQENFAELSTLTRRLEQILGYLLREQVKVDSSLTDPLLTICDCIQSLLDQNPSSPRDPASTLAQAEPVLTNLELRLSQSDKKENQKDSFNDILQTIEEIELALVTVEDDELSETLKTHAKDLLRQGQNSDQADVVSIAQTFLTSLNVSPKSAHYIGHMALGGLQRIRAELVDADISSSPDCKKFAEPKNLVNEALSGKTEPPLQQVAASLSPACSETSSQSTVNDVHPHSGVLSDYTLEINKLLVWLYGSAVFSIPYDKIEENLTVETTEIFQIGSKRYLEWQGQMIPLFQLSDLLKKHFLIPGIDVGKTLEKASLSGQKTPLRLIIRLANKFVALESYIEKLITQSEIVVSPFATALNPGEFCYGFSVLEEERLATVIDIVALLNHTLEQSPEKHDAASLSSEQASHSVEALSSEEPLETISSAASPKILVIENTLDQELDQESELVFALQKLGYGVTKLQDGQEAIAQIRRDSTIKLVICEFGTNESTDILFLNDLMFLSYRLKEAQLAEIPVALVSSCHSSQLQKIAMMMGATTYFSKPYDGLLFSDKIKQLMQLTADGNQYG